MLFSFDSLPCSCCCATLNKCILTKPISIANPDTIFSFPRKIGKKKSSKCCWRNRKLSSCDQWGGSATGPHSAGTTQQQHYFSRGGEGWRQGRISLVQHHTGGVGSDSACSPPLYNHIKLSLRCKGLPPSRTNKPAFIKSGSMQYATLTQRGLCRCKQLQWQPPHNRHLHDRKHFGNQLLIWSKSVGRAQGSR